MRHESGIKRLVSLIISIGYFASIRFTTFIRYLVGRRSPGRCVVLYYHAVPAGQRALFARQMDSLLRSATPLPADATIPLRTGVRYAAVTFDDGFESVLRNALPELDKRNIPATVFVIADLIGRNPGWDGYPERVMTVEELQRLPADIITIGSHTMTHPVLPLASADQAKWELSESRMTLEKLLKRRIRLFSFPYGAFNQELVNSCRKAGYERIFTTIPMPAFADPQEFVTGRVRVDPTDWPLEFRLKLFGAYRWLPIAYSAKRKLLANPLIRGAFQHLRDPRRESAT